MSVCVCVCVFVGYYGGGGGISTRVPVGFVAQNKAYGLVYLQVEGVCVCA